MTTNLHQRFPVLLLQFEDDYSPSSSTLLTEVPVDATDEEIAATIERIIHYNNGMWLKEHDPEVPDLALADAVIAAQENVIIYGREEATQQAAV